MRGCQHPAAERARVPVCGSAQTKYIQIGQMNPSQSGNLPCSRPPRQRPGNSVPAAQEKAGMIAAGSTQPTTSRVLMNIPARKPDDANSGCSVATISRSLKVANPAVSGCRLVGSPPVSISAPEAAGALVDASSPGGRIARLITVSPYMQRRRKRGEYLFRTGDTFHSLYVLNAGFVKTCYTSEDGREQITGLHLRGDILGLDAVATGTCGCDAIALDSCDVLALRYDVVIECGQRNPELVRELYQAFSTEIRSNRDLLLSMCSLPAAARVAAFLLEMSRRFASRGFSATQLQLRLTREEIGSMLGLKLETVSRAFSRFAELGLITVCLREIVLLDRDGLLSIIAQPAERKRAGGDFLCSTPGLSPLAAAK